MSMKRFKWVILLAVVCLPLAAFGGTSQTARTAASGNAIGGKLVIDNESGSTWTCHFNAFNPAVNLTSNGFGYEPLEFVDILKTGPGAVTPWLEPGCVHVQFLLAAVLLLRREHDADRSRAHLVEAQPDQARRIQRPEP